jgi:hypothetical protein
MALRATKGDENFARSQFSFCYMDAANCGRVARLGRAGGEVFDRAPQGLREKDFF